MAANQNKKSRKTGFFYEEIIDNRISLMFYHNLSDRSVFAGSYPQ